MFCSLLGLTCCNYTLQTMKPTVFDHCYYGINKPAIGLDPCTSALLHPIAFGFSCLETQQYTLVMTDEGGYLGHQEGGPAQAPKGSDSWRLSAWTALRPAVGTLFLIELPSWGELHLEFLSSVLLYALALGWCPWVCFCLSCLYPQQGFTQSTSWSIETSTSSMAPLVWHLPGLCHGFSAFRG